jgi:hypothetical protein
MQWLILLGEVWVWLEVVSWQRKAHKDWWWDSAWCIQRMRMSSEGQESREEAPGGEAGKVKQGSTARCLGRRSH